MKNLIILGIFIINFSMFSQNEFNQGYIIDQQNKKIECWIENYKLRINPTEISYKIDKSSEIKIATATDIKEFVIYDLYKYESHKVKIDISSQNLQRIDKNRQPEWEEKTLFLKALVDNNATLYIYEDDMIVKKYFYKVNSSDVQQLIFKKYLNKDHDKLKNLTYLYQLNKDVKCGDKPFPEYSKLGYNKNDLVKYFNDYNRCFGFEPKLKFKPESVNNKLKNDVKKSHITYKRNYPKFNLKIISGINSHSLKIKKDKGKDIFFDLGSSVNFKIGLETELFFPAIGYKWSMIFTPNYNLSYNSKDTSEIWYYGIPNDEKTETVYAKIQSIELPFGFRRYFYLENEKSRIFINVQGVLYHYLNSEIKFDYLPSFDKFTGSIGFALGFGYDYNNKLSLEARFYKNSQPYIGDSWKIKETQGSIILGYNLF